MAAQHIVERVVIDCSVVCKWKLTAEPQAAQAKELLFDWRADFIQLCAPDLLPAEIRITQCPVAHTIPERQGYDQG